MRGAAPPALLAALMVLAACATTPPVPSPPSASTPGSTPAPTSGTPADWPAPLPAALTGPERVWHLRAALNVAALACPTRTGNAIVRNYNDLLKSRKSLLAAAYQAETRQFQKTAGSDWQPAFDRYMTKLYNRYAWPPAQSPFCTAADAIAAEAVQISPSDFEAFAVTGLARIEQALAFTPPAETTARVAVAALLASPPPATAIWRIQLGAFTGQPAATAAWQAIQTRLPGLASYIPHFEPVPTRPGLVRLQIGNSADRDNALTLCALAAAGGFDCIPVRPGN